MKSPTSKTHPPTPSPQPPAQSSPQPPLEYHHDQQQPDSLVNHNIPVEEEAQSHMSMEVNTTGTGSLRVRNLAKLILQINQLLLFLGGF